MNKKLSLPRNAKLYLITQFLIAGYYTWPFWFGFATESITPTQFGVYMALAYFVGVLAEVPTGAFGDSFGRRRSAIIGIFCHVPMLALVFLGHDFGSYLLAAVFSGIGGAFISGSLESEVYDSEGVNPKIFRKVMNYEIIAWQSGLIVATALGGLMFELWRPLPFIVETVSFLLSVGVILAMVPAKAKHESNAQLETKLKKYINQNVRGFSHLFEVKQLRSLLIFWSVVSVAVWVGIENTNEASMIHFGISPEYRGYLLAGVKVFNLVLLNLLILKRVKTDRAKLLFVFSMLLAAYSFYAFDSKNAFLFGFLLFNLASSTFDNFIKPIVHDHLDSRWRATAISSISFIKGLLIGLSLLVIGWGLDKFGVIQVNRVIFVFLACTGCVSLAVFLAKLKDLSWQKNA